MTAVLAPPAPPPEAGTYRMMAPCEKATPRLVRDWVALLCREAGLSALVDDVQLCVSEAVTNVVLHTRTTLVVTDVTLRAHDVSVCVHDTSPEPVPMPCEFFSDEERGRGLLIVARLSKQWGVTFFGGLELTGKAVWFRIEKRGADDVGN